MRHPTSIHLLDIICRRIRRQAFKVQREQPVLRMNCM